LPTITDNNKTFLFLEEALPFIKPIIFAPQLLKIIDLNSA